MRLTKLSIVGLIGLLLLSSCNEEEIKVSFPSTDGATVAEVKGDLYYINGDSNLGEGINTSGNAQEFLDCSTPAVSFFPDYLKGMIVAFGAVTIPNADANCGYCNIRYGCSPGDTVLLEYWGLSSSFVNNFDDFESNINIASTASESIQCPSDGVLEISSDNTGAAYYQKVSVSSVEGSDTEYMKCF